jgi:hypothetical protein
MLAESFRSVTARLIPRPCRCKQVALLGVLILAGCGGSSTPKESWQTVRGPGFRFQAPSGWTVKTLGEMTTASQDSELSQVATFPLARIYTARLFTKVESELALRMAQVAKQTGGTVEGHSVVAPAGIRSHSYDVRVGDHVDEYTFVLRGMREYQLLCRRKSSDHAPFCERLVSSFTL